MQPLPNEVRRVVEEAQALIAAAWHTANRRRFNRLLDWARQLLQPLADEGVGEAMWVVASLPQRAGEGITNEEFDRRHELNARAAASAGSAAAMFFLGCQLDTEPTITESTNFFRTAAEKGHTYSKWCYGLNLLSGRGIPRNEELGLRFIREAGEEHFEGAIQFMSHAYSSGTYGLPKDEKVAASWLLKLKDKSLIRY